MFPTGLPGLALLLLRASVVVALFLESYGHRQGLSGWLLSGAGVLIVALSLGYMTPVGALLALLYHGLIWLNLGSGNTGEAILVCFDALALTLLGPGAYSIDGYLFGRRLLLLPPR
jgi:hypothetical protein